MVTGLVTSFHAQNLVHGDIQDTNLLVRVNDGTVEVKLIDFDWGGKKGEVRNPVLINGRTVVRPSNVVNLLAASLSRPTMIWSWLRLFSRVVLDLVRSHIRVSNISDGVSLYSYSTP
jgi:serine/threonine protein kinase